MKLLKIFSQNKISYLRLSCHICLLIISCNVFAKRCDAIQELPSTELFQLGNASALFSGAIEGEVKYSQLKSKGDFGLGTFNDIDGEMVALNGNFYKISQKGKTIIVQPNWKTPFVELVKFSPCKAIHLQAITSYTVLKQLLNEKLGNKNIPYAIKITGKFQALKLRSRSTQPVVQTQNKLEETYTIENVTGTLVGFWFPDYLLSLTVPEFHFHFISEDKKVSGHVLDLKAKWVNAFMNKINQIALTFPQTQVYKNAKISAATLDKYNNAQMNNQ